MVHSIPQWLHDLHRHDHIESVILTLAKRERARDAARARSRRRSSSSKKDRLSGTFSAFVSGSLPTTSSGGDEKTDHYSVAVGNLRENHHANRYLNLEPYDRTRVVVGEGVGGKLHEGQSGISEGRYLNANWVRELAGGKWWIATQAPLPGTLHAFLSVILQPISRPPPDLHTGPYASKTSRVRTVVQLTPNIERGMQKAHIYFPPNTGEYFTFAPEAGHSAPDLRVTLLKTQVHKVAQCVQSTVSIRPIGAGAAEAEPIVFTHMLYGAWPDHGVPAESERASLLAFARLVDTVNRDTAALSDNPSDVDLDPPIMVGCSAGIGRTGSYIALCSLLRANGLLPPCTPEDAPLAPLPTSPLGPLPGNLRDDPIACEIDALREQRPGMVQREEQIVLIYEALALAFVQRGVS